MLIAAWILVPFSPAVGGSQKGEPVQNPHWNVNLCNACHKSPAGGKGDLREDGDISKLCRSCHDGRSAAAVGHPSEIKPSSAIRREGLSDFPLQDGVLTCLSCHDMVPACKPAAATTASGPAFLRGNLNAVTPDFCYRCHATEGYSPLNPHNQLEGGQVRDSTCAWCHLRVPDRNAGSSEAASCALRDNSPDICANCHSMGSRHPVEGNHLGVVPTSEMLSFMAAAELQDRMNMPFDALLKMVAASGRVSRQLPLDEQNRITCYTCHNPHEKDLLPARSPRAVGAEPDKSVNYRLRLRQGDNCGMCHNK